MNRKQQKAVQDAIQELESAKENYPKNFNSLHEGYAVLKEEVDELWDEIKMKNPDELKVYTEAKQVVAMGLRIMSEF